MHSVLFVVTNPKRPADWDSFLDHVRKKLAKTQHVERLDECVWLVNFQADPAAFGWLISGAVNHKISYRMLVLESEPQWLPVGSYPNTTQGQNGGSN